MGPSDSQPCGVVLGGLAGPQCSEAHPVTWANGEYVQVACSPGRVPSPSPDSQVPDSLCSEPRFIPEGKRQVPGGQHPLQGHSHRAVPTRAPNHRCTRVQVLWAPQSTVPWPQTEPSSQSPPPKTGCSVLQVLGKLFSGLFRITCPAPGSLHRGHLLNREPLLRAPRETGAGRGHRATGAQTPQANLLEYGCSPACPLWAWMSGPGVRVAGAKTQPQGWPRQAGVNCSRPRETQGCWGPGSP